VTIRFFAVRFPFQACFAYVCVWKGKELFFWGFAATSRLEQVLAKHLQTPHVCLIVKQFVFTFENFEISEFDLALDDRKPRSDKTAL